MGSHKVFQTVFLLAGVFLLLFGCSPRSDYSDGTWRFLGDSSDEDGWTPVLVAEVEDGAVVRARYDYLSSDGAVLSEDFEALRIRSHAENIDLEQALSLLGETFEEQPEADIEADGPPWLVEPFDRLTAAFRNVAADGEGTAGGDGDEILTVEVGLTNEGLDPSLAAEYVPF